MESRADRPISQAGDKKKFNNLNTSTIKILDNLVLKSENFLDTLPATLKKVDTFIGNIPQTISNYLYKYPNLPAILGYGILGFISAYLSIAVLDAINDIPLLGEFFEVVGLVYSIWFGVRYLLFASNREELNVQLKSLKVNIIN